jgi:hypothetical protein
MQARERVFDRALVCDVRRTRERAPRTVRLLDVARQRLDFGRRPRDERDARASRREQARGRGADAAAGSRHDRDLPL